jgi:hypothetical protein
MQRVNRSSAVVSLPAPPAGGTPGFFTGGNPGGGTPATVPGYEWFNGVQEELIGLILRGGISASNADLAQVRKSLDRLFGGGLATYAANTTLTVDDAGLVLVNASGGARTITLPAANALGGRPIRYQIEKTDNSANAVTVQRAGSDTIEGATSVVLSGQWASVTLVSDGVSGWVVLRGRFATAAETDAGTLSDVAVTPASLGIATRNYANPGYARLPGGLILQWGVTNSADVPASPGTLTLTATFPIAFPNAVFNLQGSRRSNGSNGGHLDVDASATLTGCSFFLQEYIPAGQNVSVAYLAIGR